MKPDSISYDTFYKYFIEDESRGDDVIGYLHERIAETIKQYGQDVLIIWGVRASDMIRLLEQHDRTFRWPQRDIDEVVRAIYKTYIDPRMMNKKLVIKENSFKPSWYKKKTYQKTDDEIAAEDIANYLKLNPNTVYEWLILYGNNVFLEVNKKISQGGNERRKVVDAIINMKPLEEGVNKMKTKKEVLEKLNEIKSKLKEQNQSYYDNGLVPNLYLFIEYGMQEVTGRAGKLKYKPSDRNSIIWGYGKTPNEAKKDSFLSLESKDRKYAIAVDPYYRGSLGLGDFAIVRVSEAFYDYLKRKTPLFSKGYIDGSTPMKIKDSIYIGDGVSKISALYADIV